MLRVLTYHRIAAGPDDYLNPRLISASPEEFDRQLAYVSANFDVVTASDVVEWAAFQRPLPRRALLITFDDAYRDFADVAWPLLRRRNLPCVLFVPTAYPGTARPFWWDRLYHAFLCAQASYIDDPGLGLIRLTNKQELREQLRATQNKIKSMPHAEGMALVESLCRALRPPQTSFPRAVLNWHELRELASQGVALCAHTRTHPVLTQLTSDQLWGEIAGSQRDLQREIGCTAPLFAYPAGGWNQAVRECVRRAGFAAAFTTKPGLNRGGEADPLLLRRTNISLRTSRLAFRVRISALGNWLDAQRAQLRSYA